MAIYEPSKKSLPDKGGFGGKSSPKSIFDKTSLGARRSDVKREFMRIQDKTTGWGQHRMGPQEKRLLDKEILPRQKYGENISRKEIDNRISKLKRYFYTARYQGDSYQASKFKDQIDFLEKLKKK